VNRFSLQSMGRSPDGTVTLRGPVKSDREKAEIEAKAKQVAGVKRVENQLEIAS
jgi:hyperosmotically inducible periplasmic protein